MSKEKYYNNLMDRAFKTMKAGLMSELTYFKIIEICLNKKKKTV